jgi:ketosteroid isomerase-like protein
LLLLLLLLVLLLRLCCSTTPPFCIVGLKFRRLQFVESFEFVDDGYRRHEELDVVDGELAGGVETGKLSHATERDVRRHCVLVVHDRIAPLGDDDFVERLALDLVDGDGAGRHERELRHLDRDRLGAERRRQRRLARKHRKDVSRQRRQSAERRRAAVTELDVHDFGQHVADRDERADAGDELDALLRPRVVVVELDRQDRAVRAVGRTERRRNVLRNHHTLTYIEIRCRRHVAAVLGVVAVEQHFDVRRARSKLGIGSISARTQTNAPSAIAAAARASASLCLCVRSNRCAPRGGGNAYLFIVIRAALICTIADA